ncbi:hypothetical protein EVA_04828 [gut metagenome]|uniref:Uncharacterized protein n=1 Tax=gut metagenome TaxID=749906 RepID=J9GHT4_9ZZZZ
MAIFLNHLASALFFQSVVGTAEAVVLDPAVVVVEESLSFSNDIAIVEGQCRELSGVRVEGNADLLVADFDFVKSRSLGQITVLGLESREGTTFYQGELLVGNLVACFCEDRCFTIDYVEVEEGFDTLLLCLDQIRLLQFQNESQTVVRSDGRQRHALRRNDIAVLHDVPYEVEGRQVLERITVVDAYTDCILLCVEAGQGELDKLVGSLDFLQFAALVTSGRNDTVGAEVTLVRARIVITCMQTVEALLHFLWVIDGLVNPVPDTTTDAGIGIFDDVPVFAQVTDGVTHGVSIFADEHRLVQVARVLVHPSHTWIHLGVEVREASATIGTIATCSFIMDRTAVEAFGCRIAVTEILTVAGFITQTPHNHRRMVAVAEHEAVDTVNKSRNP